VPHCTYYNPGNTDTPCSDCSERKRKRHIALQGHRPFPSGKSAKRISTDESDDDDEELNFTKRFAGRLTPIQLSGLTYPVRLNQLSVMQYTEEPMSMSALSFNGKPLLVFGESCANGNHRHELLLALNRLKEMGVKSIFCFHSKRALNRLKFESGITSETLPEFYEKYGFKAYCKFNGVDFHIGDLAEVGLSAKVSDKIKNEIYLLLKKHHNFGTVLKHCSNPAGLQSLINYLKKEQLPTLSADMKEPTLLNMNFIPTKNQIKAYIGAISSAFQNGGMYLHCASGIGRTAFYVLLLVMYWSKCTFSEALEFMGDQYPSCYGEIKEEYSICKPHERFTDLIR
jgi:hypothetical protein